MAARAEQLICRHGEGNAATRRRMMWEESQTGLPEEKFRGRCWAGTQACSNRIGRAGFRLDGRRGAGGLATAHPGTVRAGDPSPRLACAGAGLFRLRGRPVVVLGIRGMPVRLWRAAWPGSVRHPTAAGVASRGGEAHLPGHRRPMGDSAGRSSCWEWRERFAGFLSLSGRGRASHVDADGQTTPGNVPEIRLAPARQHPARRCLWPSSGGMTLGGKVGRDVRFTADARRENSQSSLAAGRADAGRICERVQPRPGPIPRVVNRDAFLWQRAGAFDSVEPGEGR